MHDGGWGWGAAFIDFNNDGYLDIIMTNGKKCIYLRLFFIIHVLKDIYLRTL